MSNTISANQNLNVKHVATLFEEVQSRYVKKLTSIDEKHIAIDDRHKQKLAVYESYVKDLSIQARLLLQSLDELEKEANQRVSLLEIKLKKAHASLQQQHLSDVSKTVGGVESERWKLSHENLDLKHDLDSLTAFINTAKRTGKWDTKRLQLKTMPVDSITGITSDEFCNSTPLHREVQYRDERIQVLQAEIEQLKKAQDELALQAASKQSTLSPYVGEDDLKAQNLVLAKKVDDLRTKLADECQHSETHKMDLRVKLNELKECQEELKRNKQRSEEHIHDLSTKLKTISDRHREATAVLNNDLKGKKQQIEQYVQQMEQLVNEKMQLENERSDLQRECRVKDSINNDLEEQVRALQREVAANNYPATPIQPLETTVPKAEYDKLDQELHSTRKRLESLNAELKTNDALVSKLEQDLRFAKKLHDEQLEQHFQTSTSDADQLHAEIRSLKRLCEEKDEEFERQSLDLRTCQDQLAIEQTKTVTLEDEQQQLRETVQLSNEQIEKLERSLQETTSANEQLEYTVNDLNSQSNMIETKLFETMTLVDLRNKALMDYEEDLERVKGELAQKHKENADKQAHIDELQQIVIDKTAEVAQLSETLETGLVKSHHREKFAEDNATKALHDVKVLQREVRHLSKTLAEREQTNAALKEELQQISNDFKGKQEEFHKTQKALNKQLAIKHEQLTRCDQSLHDLEIKSKYAKEECLIQEKEIVRLNDVQEEQEARIKTLQQDLLKLQEEREALAIQYERSELDLRNTKGCREDDHRKFTHELEQLNSEITSLRDSERALLTSINELKSDLSETTGERNDLREQNENYQHELENIQKMLYNETEVGSKSAAKVVMLTRQLDEEQKRATDAMHQAEDTKMQLKSIMMINETLKNELAQTRSLIQEHTAKEAELGQSVARSEALIEDNNQSLETRQREIETLNHLISRLQIDYEKSKSDLSKAHDDIVQHEIENQILKQHSTDKANELSTVTNRLHQVQQEFHAYEKEHRYANEEYFEQEQRLKAVESELAITLNGHEKLRDEHALLNEELTKCRYDLEQMELSDTSHKERLIQSMDEAKIYKRKLTLLGNCFKTVVRKASETSEQWVVSTSKLHEQITDLSEDANKLRSLDERLEQSAKMLTVLRAQHEDLILQFMAVKPVLEKAYLYVREYKRKWSQTSNDNRHLRAETKRMRSKIDDFHRAEGLMHGKIDEQEATVVQLRKELTTEAQTHFEAETLIERLKHTLDDTIHERDQLAKNMSSANKKIEKYENDIDGYTNDIRLLHQQAQKFEKQLASTHGQNDSLQKTLKQNELSYQEKINECELLLISLKEANKNTLGLLEQKKNELNVAQSEMQAFKYQQAATVSKFEKVDEMNQELKKHIALLERSNDEYKRLARKRDHELEQVKSEFDASIKSTSTLNSKCTKQDAELNTLRHENTSLNEELKLMRENVTRCQEEQKRLRKDCDQALNFIHEGIPELCLDDSDSRSGSLQDNLKKIPALMQQLSGDRDNLKSKNAVLQQFVRGLSQDLNGCQTSQKKYKMLKAHSKQQQVLLNQLETHLRFYESVFKEKGFFPAIEYPAGATMASAPDVIDKTHHRRN